ncbi:MAG: hypothetical protein AAF800_04225 [Planctomycetota bacterium]
MTHASDRKQRRRKRKQWQHRGGGGMKRTDRARLTTGTAAGAIGKTSPFWQAVIGVVTIAVVVGAVGLVLLAIFS